MNLSKLIVCNTDAGVVGFITRNLASANIAGIGMLISIGE